jgi:Polyketide cyclase / dehydrase and lipid transport
MEISSSRVIHADHAVVLAYVTDLRNDVEWRKLVSESRLVEASPTEVGARFEQTVNVMGRATTTIATLKTITGNRYVYEGLGMMTALFAVTAEPHPDGTEVTLYFSADMPAPMAKMATKGIGTDMQVDLAKLAERLET